MRLSIKLFRIVSLVNDVKVLLDEATTHFIFNNYSHFLFMVDTSLVPFKVVNSIFP